MTNFYSDLAVEGRKADALRFGGRDYNWPVRPIMSLFKSIFALPALGVPATFHLAATVCTLGFYKHARNSLLYTIYNLGMTLLNILTLGHMGYVVDKIMGDTYQDKNGLKSVVAAFQYYENVKDDHVKKTLMVMLIGNIGDTLFFISDDDIDAVELELTNIVTGDAAVEKVEDDIVLFKTLTVPKTDTTGSARF